MAVSISVVEKDIGIGIEEIFANCRELSGQGVKVGVMSGTYPDGTSVVDVAYWNEYGTSKMPSRPFIRQTFEKNGNDIDKVSRTLIGGIMTGTFNPDGALRELGDWYKGVMQEVLRDGSYVANAASTLAQKNGSKPLVDTGQLLQSIRWEKL